MTPQTGTGFIFGGDTGIDHETLQRHRGIVDAIMAGGGGAPKTIGEGLYSATTDITNAIMNRRLENSAKQGKAQGLPGYRFGTSFHPGGKAIVGEDGPEVVTLPRGSQVRPNPATYGGNKTLQWLSQNAPPELVQQVSAGQITPVDALRAVTAPRNAQMDAYDRGGPASDPDYANKLRKQMMGEGYSFSLEPDEHLRGEMGDEAFRRYQGMNEQQRLDYLNNPQNGFVPQPPMDLRELIQEDASAIPQGRSRFDDARAYRTADMSGIPPSGVGETNQLNAAARSYQTLMKGLDDYEKLFADGGSTAWPGARKDALSTAHRNLQMQMKELYNLGVLNGPDLMLMDEILLSPTSIMGNAKDALGIADMEERIPANIKNVRRMMTDLATPGLQQLGIDPKSLMPNKSAGDMSDDELLRALGE